MDAFSYTDIFDTKGIEYLIIIAFLLLIIPFWRLLNRPIKARYRFKDTNESFSEKTLKVPQGLLFNKNHAWAHLEKSGVARIGLDDLLLHLTGEVEIVYEKKPGQRVRKGEVLALVKQDDKALKIESPVTGKIKAFNDYLSKNPEALNTDPYGIGWMAKIEPENWKTDINEYYLGKDAIEWNKYEIARFKDFLGSELKSYSSESQSPVLQEGGELRSYLLAYMDKRTWEEFQQKFLKNSHEK